MNCGCHSHGSFLTAKGLAEAEQRRDASPEALEVDGSQTSLYLDKVGSVSALAEAEAFHVFDHGVIDQQYRRFLNGQ